MIRVLIVDDSPVARELVKGILDADPGLEVVGMARNGREGIELTKKLRPDVVTMDIHMPDMNGFEATKEIMIEAPTPIVIVSASTMVHEVEAAMKALRAGALTLLLKPAGPGDPRFDEASQEIVNTVKAMSDIKVVKHHRREASHESAPPVPVKLGQPAAAGIRAVAIAASTGGPPALNTVLGGLPADYPAPVLVVQHIAAGFVEGFASWLDSVIPLEVKLVEDGELLKAGTVYIAPQNQHLGITRGGRAKLSDDSPIGGFRPAGTYLFDSLAEAVGDQGVGVILTGMGRDGADGLRRLHLAGATTIAQDEQTCVVFGMPRAAIADGAATVVLPVEGIARYLINLVARAIV